MTRSAQFKPVPFRCPNCGHIVGEQAFYQSFEYKAAKWLHGQVAPSATPGYDVHKCDPFPDLTFQIKYANVYFYHAKKHTFPSIRWTWIAKHPQPNQPDFFVLFGLRDSNEFVFLLSRQEFYDYACRYDDPYNHARYNLAVSAKEKSDRANYNYIPKIWRYLVKNPSRNLVSAIHKRI